MSKQRRINVDATSSSRIDVNTMLFERYVFTGIRNGTVAQNEVRACVCVAYIRLYCHYVIPMIFGLQSVIIACSCRVT